MEIKTIVSAIVQVIVAVNEALMAFGITQFDGVTADTVYSVVSTVAMVIAWGYGLWKITILQQRHAKHRECSIN